MAKNNAKEPGQFAQIFLVLKRTIELDRRNIWIIFLPVAAVLSIGTTFVVSSFASGAWLMGILLIILSLLSTFVTFTLTLSRRAEKAAYASWEGQPGAVSAVMQTLLKSRWRGSEQPVAVNPRTYDAVYRIVGAPGIVLVGEGHQSGAQVLVDTERKKLQKIAPGVPVHTLYVTDSDHALKLSGLRKAALKLPRKLNRAEVKVVASRLTALGINMPIPKGIDPRRARPVRK
jgi:multidrug transporter EmrE-like cation transporter